MTDFHDNDRHTTEVDIARLGALGDEWFAAVCVDARGRETFWVLSPDEHGECGCCCPGCAPHEQLGALPTGWKKNTTTESTR